MPWGRHLGGYPYPIMLCNISQNAMGQTPGGVPCQVQPGGYPARGYPVGGTPQPGQDGGLPCQGGTQVGYTPLARSGWEVPCWGGTQVGYPSGQGTPQPGQDGGVPCRGGTQLGQEKEYSLHGGRYASCVHAGGLSCMNIYFDSPILFNDLNNELRLFKCTPKSFRLYSDHWHDLKYKNCTCDC